MERNDLLASGNTAAAVDCPGSRNLLASLPPELPVTPLADYLGGSPGRGEQIVQVQRLGHELVLVSSGAVSAGVAALGLPARPTDTPTLQALSAAGQSRLMEVYNRHLGARGVVAAQVLLVPHDFIDRRQYLHARQTLVR